MRSGTSLLEVLVSLVILGVISVATLPLVHVGKVREQAVWVTCRRAALFARRSEVRVVGDTLLLCQPDGRVMTEVAHAR